MGEDRAAEAAVNEAADNIDGVIAILEDAIGSYTEDKRLQAVVAALRHTRSILEPVLDGF